MSARVFWLDGLIQLSVPTHACSRLDDRCCDGRFQLRENAPQYPEVQDKPALVRLCSVKLIRHLLSQSSLRSIVPPQATLFVKVRNPASCLCPLCDR